MTASLKTALCLLIILQIFITAQYFVIQPAIGQEQQQNNFATITSQQQNKVSSPSVLNRLVRHFEPLNYNHNIAHSRAKRDLQLASHKPLRSTSSINNNDNNKHSSKQQSNNNKEHPIKLEFNAHNRNFRLNLKPDFHSVFKESSIVEDSNGNILKNFNNPFILLSGHLDGQPDSLVFGSLRKGIFEGRIQTNDSKVFYVESSKKYFDDLKQHENYRNISSLHDLPFHSVIYSSLDVIHPHKTDSYYTIDHSNEIHDHESCAGGNLSIKNWLNQISNSAVDSSELEYLDRFDEDSMSTKERFYKRMHEIYGLPYNREQQYSYLDIQKAVENDPHLNQSFNLQRHSHSRTKRQVENILDLNMFGPKPRISHRPQAELNQKQRRACTLFIQTDTTLWNHARRNHDNDLDTREEIASLVAQHIKAVNHIYENSDFGGIRGIKFIVQRLKINDTSDCEGQKLGSNRFCESNMDVSNFLNLNSQFNHNDFCLAYIFTYRDFQGGTLGLAWVASTSGASGGICEKYKSFTENVNGKQVQTKRSLNTGIITFVNYNTRVPPKVSELTLAHEIGHNFGSPHDYPHECRPGGTTGNFIMYSSATSGERTNNNKFSDCSIKNISGVLHNLFATDSKDNCFEVDNGPFCGNKIVEEGEQCDCGYNAQECTEQCCVPRERTGEEYEGLKSCYRIPGKQCSPSEGPCCSNECTLVGEEKTCRQETECSHSQNCDSRKAVCPEPAPKPNMTECNNGTQVCMSGKCGGSICIKYNLEECFIQDKCEVACQLHDQPHTCRKTSDIPQMRHLSGLNLRPGSPCNNFLGFCDTLKICRAVDADGPLVKLKNLLFNQRTLMSIKQWAITHWWACALFFIGFMFLMKVFIECCAVHTPSSNPKLRPALKIAETFRRPANTLRRKRRSHTNGRVVANGHKRPTHLTNMPPSHHRTRHSRPSSSSSHGIRNLPQNHNSSSSSGKNQPNFSRQHQPKSITSSFSCQPLMPTNEKQPPTTTAKSGNTASQSDESCRNEARALNDIKSGAIVVPGLPRKHGWYNRRNHNSTDKTRSNQPAKRSKK